jgi:hypothetical protein
MKIQKNKIYLALAFLILGILIMQNVLAIGITPARTNIDFGPGLHKEVNFSILNSEKKDMSVVFSVKGDLARYITLSKEFADFSSSETSKSFSYTIDLPDSFDVPGKYEAEIVALEVSKEVKESGTFVGATLAVITQLYVYVPYPDEYLETELKVVSSEQGSNVLFLIPITNRGKADVDEVTVFVDIYSPFGEKISTVETNKESLKKLERKELSATWFANVSPGRYTANATIHYNGKQILLSKEFDVGEILLEIKEVVVKDFQLGEIAKFDILIKNKWSHEVNNTYINIIVYNEQGEVIADFKTPNQDFQPLQELSLPAYWDTKGIQEGLYEGKLVLHYGEKKKAEKSIQLDVREYSLEVLGLTGKVVVRGKGRFNLTNILIAVVVLLILSNVVWFFIIKKIIKRKK